MEIEALRGLAVISVVVSHLGNILYWIPGLGERLAAYGWGSGVDLFFVISGFVITKAFYGQLRDAAPRGPTTFGVEVRAFMLRRLFRVMPAAIAWMMIVCACSLWFNSTGIFGSLQANFSDMIAVLFNVSNFYFVKCYSAAPHGVCGFNGIYWSVSLEEQFYLFFPLLAILPKRGVYLLTAAVVLYLGNIDRGTMDWFTRVDGLLAGVCLALASSSAAYQRISRLQLDKRVLGALVVGLSASIVLMPSLARVLPRAWPEITTLCCFVLVGLASFHRGLAFGNGPLRAVLAYVGTRSFAIYLVHNPAAWITRESAALLGHLDAKQIPTEPVLFGIAAFVVMIGLAELSFRLIEVPWRNWGRRISILTPPPMADHAHVTTDPSAWASPTNRPL